ncbi:MAG: hypothetical protein V1926_02305 [Candidatus Peregrinibacteria bacterium]
MPSSRKPLTVEETKAILFDLLMSEIEPELMIARRKETAATVSKLPPKEQMERLQHYEESFCEFLRRWPSFVEEQTRSVQGFVRAGTEEKEREDVEQIGLQFDDSAK